MLRVVVFLLMMVSPVTAGPWMRSPGSTFLAYSVESGPADFLGHTIEFASFYTEFGMTDRLTFGLEQGNDHDRNAKAFMFMRMPIGESQNELKIAAELAIGHSDGVPTLRPGISVGRNINIKGYTGWFAADTRYIINHGTSLQRLETDVTIGLNATQKTKVILQMQAGVPKYAQPYLKFAPSLVISRGNRTHTEFGLVTGVSNAPAVAVKVGTWKSF